MEFLNRIELKGVVGKAETTEMGDTSVTNFTIVTEYSSYDTNGVAVVETMWLNCTKWWSEEDTALHRQISISKGDHVHVIGRLRITNYTDQDGERHRSVGVIARSVSLLD